MLTARRIISSAARRVNVSRGVPATPEARRQATRCAMVFVFPLPAPATTRSGPSR